MHPDPLLLPGQAAAPAGPADMTMMYVLHHAFRRDLRDFTTAAAVTSTHDAPQWSRLAARWRLFAHELHQHHAEEDEILWPLLLDRAGVADDVAAERVLHEMKAEHAVIDPLLAAATSALDRLCGEGDDSIHEVLRETLAELTMALGLHLSHEERAAIAILQRYVGGEEWAELERTGFRTGQSVSQARFFVPWALKGLSAEAEQRALRAGGRAIRVIHAVSRHRFLAQEAEAFGFTAV